MVIKRVMIGVVALCIRLSIASSWSDGQSAVQHKQTVEVYGNGDVQTALHQFRVAAKQNPLDWITHFNLAQIIDDLTTNRPSNGIIEGASLTSILQEGREAITKAEALIDQSVATEEDQEDVHTLKVSLKIPRRSSRLGDGSVPQCIFAVPTYPPHFSFLPALLASYEEYGVECDLALVMSDAKDLAELNEMFPAIQHDAHIRTLVVMDDARVTPELWRQISNKKPRPLFAVFKKLWAIDQLHRQYPLIAAIDCESVFIRKTDVLSQLRSFVLSKRLWAHPVAQDSSFMGPKACKDTLETFWEPQDVALLSQQLAGCTLWSWFNDIPVYDTAIWPDFRQQIGFDDLKKFIDKIQFHHFEYNLWWYHAMLHHAYRTIDIKDILPGLKVDAPPRNGLNEVFTLTPEFRNFRTNGYVRNELTKVYDALRPMWAASLGNACGSNGVVQAMKDVRSFCRSCFLTFHLDRCNPNLKK